MLLLQLRIRHSGMDEEVEEVAAEVEVNDQIVQLEAVQM